MALEKQIVYQWCDHHGLCHMQGHSPLLLSNLQSQLSHSLISVEQSQTVPHKIILCKKANRVSVSPVTGPVSPALDERSTKPLSVAKKCLVGATSKLNQSSHSQLQRNPNPYCHGADKTGPQLHATWAFSTSSPTTSPSDDTHHCNGLPWPDPCLQLPLPLPVAGVCPLEEPKAPNTHWPSPCLRWQPPMADSPSRLPMPSLWSSAQSSAHSPGGLWDRWRQGHIHSSSGLWGIFSYVFIPLTSWPI